MVYLLKKLLILLTRTRRGWNVNLPGGLKIPLRVNRTHGIGHFQNPRLVPNGAPANGRTLGSLAETRSITITTPHQNTYCACIPLVCGLAKVVIFKSRRRRYVRHIIFLYKLLCIANSAGVDANTPPRVCIRQRNFRSLSHAGGLADWPPTVMPHDK